MSRLPLAAVAAIALQSMACAGPAESPGPRSPRYVRLPQVHYPFTMLNQGIEGHVKVAVVIGQDGKPKNMWVAQSSGHASFDNEAMNALRLAVWAPQSADVVAVVPINFVIQK